MLLKSHGNLPSVWPACKVANITIRTGPATSFATYTYIILMGLYLEIEEAMLHVTSGS